MDLGSVRVEMFWRGIWNDYGDIGRGNAAVLGLSRMLKRRGYLFIEFIIRRVFF